MNMTPRAYAVSLGLAKDARGRMSAEAHEAIAKARANGMVFDESAKAPAPKVVDGVKVVKAVVKAGAYDAKKVRAWAKSNGIEVNARGRLSAEVLDAYRKANPDVKPSETGEHVRAVGKDIRPHAMPTRSPRTEYTIYRDNKTIRVNKNEACKCGYSLAYCKCGSPVVWGMDVVVRNR